MRSDFLISVSLDLSLVVVDGQVLSVTFDRGEGTHGHTTDRVGGEELPQLLALVTLETEPHIFKGSLLGTKGGSLAESQRTTV